MKYKSKLTALIIILLSLTSCQKKEAEINILFLHHSTGRVLWNGDSNSKISKFILRKSKKISNLLGIKADVPKIFSDYNKTNSSSYLIEEQIFPKASPYGWNNFPYDYYNIWCKNEGINKFEDEPTLEILTQKYQVIIFKHCFPIGSIEEDNKTPDINSDIKTLANYKLQYEALKTKMNSFPDTKFILFTGPALTKNACTEEEAARAKAFYNWVKNKWNEDNDNIFLWDLYSLQTENELYFNEKYSTSDRDSHPNELFAGKVAPLFANRVIDVIENNGNKTTLNGELLDK